MDARRGKAPGAEEEASPFSLAALFRRAFSTMVLSLLAMVIGAATGALDMLFASVLSVLGAFRTSHPYLLIPFLPLAGLFLIWYGRRWGRDSFSAMDESFHAAFGETARLPWRTIPFVMLSAWITHFFGGSAGRAGVAVPMGAVMANHMGAFLRNRRARRILLLSGMAAGFGGLFQTPVAGVFFAMEILTSGGFDNAAFLPALAAAWCAYFTASFLGMERLTLTIADPLPFDPASVILLAGCGILFGLTGGTFAWSMKWARSFLAAHMRNPYGRIALCGAFVAAASLLIHDGRYSGLSLSVTAAAFTGGVIYSYDFLAKYILTIVTRASGYQGGEVMPLLCIGASLGAALSPILGIPAPFLAACGAVGVLSGATSTLLAPLALGMELFGWSAMPFFFTVTVMARAVNQNQSLYGLQKHMSIL